MSQPPPPPPGGPFGSVGTYPQEPPQPNDHDLSRPAYQASRYQFGSSPEADQVLATNPRRRSNAAVLGLSLTGFIGAALVAVSAFLPWTGGALADDAAAKPGDRSIRWLWDLKALTSGSPKLIVPILVAAALVVVGAVVRPGRWLLAVGGVAAVILGGLHVKQLNALTVPNDPSFLRLVGIGAWLCIVGGLLAIGGWFIVRRDR